MFWRPSGGFSTALRPVPWEQARPRWGLSSQPWKKMCGADLGWPTGAMADVGSKQNVGEVRNALCDNGPWDWEVVVKSGGECETSPYLRAHELAWDRAMEAGRRCKSPGPETRAHCYSSNTSGCSIRICAASSAALSTGRREELQAITTHTAHCVTREEPWATESESFKRGSEHASPRLPRETALASKATLLKGEVLSSSSKAGYYADTLERHFGTKTASAHEMHSNEETQGDCLSLVLRSE